jgi:hypothetical protein
MCLNVKSKFLKATVLSFLTLLVASCSDSGKKEYGITRFDKVITDTLVPKKDGSYTYKFITLKGYTDDSIYVSFGGNTFKRHYKGNIDVHLNPDYYGATKAIFVFDPYKAKKGDLKIKFGIQ